MTGLPSLAGFTAKLNFAIAATKESGVIAVTVLAALAISTLLNALYFIRTVIRIYTPTTHSAIFSEIVSVELDENRELHPKRDLGLVISSVGFVSVIVILGIFSEPIIEMIKLGLSTFA